MLSIVIPTLNESRSGYLPKILNTYKALKNCEIICVDGGSEDDTCEIINLSQARCVKTQIVSRAGRLNEGIKQAQYELVLLHHPRSLLTVSALQSLIHQRHQLSWGAFTHEFDCQHPLLAFTSWYSNTIRGDLRAIYYLDHCLFAKKSLLLKVGLLPEIDIFEDTELCLRLNKKARPVRLMHKSTTSAIRFRSAGIYRQAMKNQWLKWMYYLQRSHNKMNQFYEQDLPLNSQYNKPKDEP